MADLLERIFRFGLVGISGIVVDFSITWLCKEKFRLNKFIANGIGFTTAVISNYLLNRVWTFENHNPHIARQFLAFAAVSVVGLGFNTWVLYYLNETKKMNFYLSKAIAIAVVFCWNFAANAFFTFR